MDNIDLKTRLNGKMQSLQPEAAKGTVIDMPCTQPIGVNDGYTALTGNALDIINENLKHQPLSLSLFDIVKSPSGGSTVFAVPGIAGEEAEKELIGIILDYTTPRAYWETPEPVEGEPPLCFSRDSLVSFDGKPCAHCPHNDFGSNGKADSNGKACKESVQIFLLRPDCIMPLIVRVPASSKLIFQRYMTRLIGRMIPLSGVVTRIALEKATSKAGKPYALYNFEAMNTLTQEEAVNAHAFGAKFMEFLNVDDEECFGEAI
jgi:hypothetical protein